MAGCAFCQSFLGKCPDMITPKSKACYKRLEKAKDAEFKQDLERASGNSPSHELSWGYNNPRQR